MLKCDQDHDHDLLANQEPTILAKLCTLIILRKKRKKSDNFEGSNFNKNLSFCSEDGMISEGSEDEIDENESQQGV